MTKGMRESLAQSENTAFNIGKHASKLHPPHAGAVKDLVWNGRMQTAGLLSIN